MLKKAVLLITVLMIFLSACQAKPAPPTEATEIGPATEAASPVPPTIAPTPTSAAKATEVVSPSPYPPISSGSVAYPAPYPGLQAEAGYPGPYPDPYPGDPANSVATYQPYVFKTSTPGSATIHGVLLVTDPMLSRPQENDAIYLVPLVGQDVMSIPSFEVGKVPQAEVDEITGEFSFTNIKPGRYAVVVLTVGDAQLPARYYEKEGFVILNVKDTDLGQTIELEYIYI